MSKLKEIITEQLNKLKNEAKNKINNITSKIPKYFDNFIELIDKILNLKFEGITIIKDKKINIINHILNFILEVESGNIKLKKASVIVKNIFFITKIVIYSLILNNIDSYRILPMNLIS